MDQASTCVLEVRICSSRRNFSGGFSFSWSIDLHAITTMKGFLDAISAQYSWVVWSDDETIIVEWFDSISEKYKPVANDEELMTMFECFKQVRHGKVALKVLNEHEKKG